MKIPSSNLKKDYSSEYRFRVFCAFLLLMALLVVFFLMNLAIGSVHVSVGELFQILSHKESDFTKAVVRILWDIRLPRVLSACLLGGALSVAGFMLQTFFANPIAGPFVLGISSGAKLMVAIAMIILLGNGIGLSALGMIAAAFLGSMISMGFVLLISKQVHSMSILVICGVMVGYICSAITEFMVTFADDSNIVNLHNWSLGSFSGMSWHMVKIMSLVIGISMFFIVFMLKPMQAYQMGEAYAHSLGVNLRLFMWALILLSSILSATVTAFAGPISFVGVAVPHLMKSLLKTSKPILIIPASFLGGAVFCMFCDLIARSVFAPTELSISSVTAVFGAPVVIYIMMSKSSKRRV